MFYSTKSFGAVYRRLIHGWPNQLQDCVNGLLKIDNADERLLHGEIDRTVGLG